MTFMLKNSQDGNYHSINIPTAKGNGTGPGVAYDNIISQNQLYLSRKDHNQDILSIKMHTKNRALSSLMKHQTSTGFVESRNDDHQIMGEIAYGSSERLLPSGSRTQYGGTGFNTSHEALM